MASVGGQKERKKRTAFAPRFRLFPIPSSGKTNQSGFAVAPILYLLAMAGVAAGVLFSGYSQILRANLNVTNATAAKGDLSGGATTLSATAVLGGEQTVFCPPRGPNASVECASAPQKLVEFSSAEASKLPSSYAIADDSGGPFEVGVFAAGAGIKQLDPWGRHYIYCRWENPTASGASPAIAIISAGANGTLETECGDETPRGDDQMTRTSVAEAINRASVWQQSDGSTEASFGAPGSKVTVTADGIIEAQGLLLAQSATITGTLNLSSPLPIESGGTGASTQGAARTNLGAGSVGDQVFTSSTAAAARTILGATAEGSYLFAGTGLVAETASSVRFNLLGAGAAGNDLFLAATATDGRAALGATAMAHYLFGATAYDATAGAQVRTTLLGGTTIGNAVFTASNYDIALNALGATELGKAIFQTESASAARSTLGAGTEGSLLFTATSQLHAWEILGLTGTLNPSLNVNVTGSAGSVDAGNITGGAVPIVHGGTSATTASGALDNLFSGDVVPGSGKLNSERIGARAINSSQMTEVVATGTYNVVEVDSAGRVVAGNYITWSPNELGDGAGNSIVATATGGGYLYFSTASTVWMALSPTGYLGVGTTNPRERLHVNDGNIRISGEAGTSREIQFTTGETDKRWILSTNAVAESGSNAGSNFVINRVTDAGAEIAAMAINRATGATTFDGTVAASGGFYGVFTGTFSGTVIGGGGGSLGTSASTTSPSRSDDATTGLFSATASTVSVATAGAERLRIGPTGALSVQGAAASAGAVLDLAGATGTAFSSMILPKDTTDNRPTTGVVGMMRYNTTLGRFEGYTTSGWGSLGSGGSGSGETIYEGFPDAITCVRSTDSYTFVLWLRTFKSAAVAQYAALYTSNAIDYNSSTGAYSSHTNLSNFDCVTNAWSIADLYAQGRAFNLVGGGGGDLATDVLLGTATSATNPHRDGDPTTGLFSATASTVSIATAGVERLRIGPTGALSVQGAAASAGAVLDLAGATGTAFSSMILPKDTTDNRPTTGVVGMMRYNTTLGAFEGYTASGWGSLGGGGGSGGGGGDTMVEGWPDAIICVNTSGASRALWFYHKGVTNVTYRAVFPTTDYSIAFSATTAAYASNTNMSDYDCVSNTWSIADLYAQGRAFNLVADDGGGAAYLGTLATLTAPSRSDDVTTGLFSDTASTVSIATAGVERLRVTATGSVGIGTTTPDYPFVIEQSGTNANMALTSYGFAPAYILRRAGGTKAAPTGVVSEDVLGAVVFQGYSGTGFTSRRAAVLGYAAENWSGSASGAHLAFETTPTGSTTLAERMRITATGSVGIGTTTPSYKVQIAETSATDNTTGLRVDHTGAVSGTGYGGVFVKSGASTTNVAGYFSATGGTNNYGLIVANGEVGIGTTTPSVSLDVGSKTDAVRLPGGTTEQRPTAAVGMMRYNTTLGRFEGYTTSGWGSLGSGGSGSGETIVSGWPDVITCAEVGAYNGERQYYLGDASFRTDGKYYYYSLATGWISYNSNGTFSGNNSTSGSPNCVTNAWSISDLYAQGRAFNLVGGGGGDLATDVLLGTATSATNPHRDGDPTTGLFSATASTVSIATAGAERLRIGPTGALSVQGAAASAGAVLDLAGATGTAFSSMILPKDTTDNRPTTGVVGMMRYNTTLGAFEGYTASGWGSLGGEAGSGYLGTAATTTSPSRSDDATTGLFSDTASTVAIATAGTERLRVTATGSVGIGTTTPAAVFDVLPPGNSAHAYIANHGCGAGIVGLGFSSTLTGCTDYALVGNGTNTYLNAPSGTLYFRRGNNDEMTLASAGLGIGTTTPSVSLDVGSKTDAVRLPGGTTEQRPTAAVGMMRYNTTLGQFEGYTASGWGSLGGEAGSGYLGTAATTTSPSRSDDVTTGLFSASASTVSASVAGSEVFRLTATGAKTYLTTANASGVGLYNTLSVEGTLTADRANYGAYNSVANSAAENGHLNSFYGSYSLATNASGSGYENAFGSYSGVVNNDGSKTNATSIGGYHYVENAAAGTLTTARGGQGYVVNSSTGEIEAAHGVWAGVVNDAAGTIGEAVGVRSLVRNDDGAMTEAYGVYSRVNQNVAGGSIGASYAFYADQEQAAGTSGAAYLYYGRFQGDHTAKWGLYLTGETSNYLSGTLGIKTESVTAGSVLDLSGATGTAFSSMILPKDTTDNRPTTGVVGMIRYNTTLGAFEGYTASGWGSLGEGGGGGTIGSVDGACGADNDQTLSSAPTNLCSAGIAFSVSGSGPWSWTCRGLGTGASAQCSANANTINGTCGAADGSLVSAEPAANLCATGTASTVMNNYSAWSWTCVGATGGTSQSCSAYANGSCGAVHQTYVGHAPSQEEACASGLLANLLGSGPWTWTCQGSLSGGGSNASCEAYGGVDGVCGSANGDTVAGTPTGTQLCAAGTASAVTGTAGTNAVLTWSCQGEYGGASASCATVDSCASAVGSICTDNTRYAGISPDGNYQMFIPRCDIGQVWDSSACTGTRSTLSWGATSTTTGYTSALTGRANTNWLVTNYSSVPSAQACYDSTVHGKTDWYLPAKDELALLWTGAGSTVAGMNSTWGSTFVVTSSTYYWTSTEFSSANSYRQTFFTGGASSNVSKATTTAMYTRCVRRTGADVSMGTPDAFSFTNVTGQALGATITSNTVTLVGGFADVAATCGAGCTAIARNGVWGGTTVTGFNSGDTIAIRQTSSASYSTATTATVAVGSTTSTAWQVTTMATPTAFSFTNQTNVTPSATITSNTVTLAGAFTNLTATCNAGCTDIAINGVWAGSGSVSGVSSGDSIAIRQTASANYSTATTASVTIGNTTSSVWSVTTMDGDTAGVCGTANGDTVAGAPVGALACASGAPSAVTGIPGTTAALTWTCSGTSGPPANCASVDSCALSIGAVCTDGSQYAGVTPDGNHQMFLMRCDIGQTWDGGSNCTGTRSMPKWGTKGLVTGYTSENTGQLHTDLLVGNYATYTDTDSTVGVPAAQACYDATTHGKTDWYLPALAELRLIWTGAGSTSAKMTSTYGGTFLLAQSADAYWSSTESLTARAYVKTFYTGGGETYPDKGATNNVRCVRRQGPETTAGTPSAFSFTDQTLRPLGAETTSNTVTLAGDFWNQSASCGAGCTDIAINGVWSGTSVSGVKTGDTIAIKQTASASYNTATTATVTVGGRTSSAWSVTTTPTASAFSFTNRINVATGATVTSNIVTLAGGFTDLIASCGAGCTAIAKNGVWGGATVTGFNSGDTITIRQTASASAATATTASVTVGGTTSTAWQVTTSAADAGACGSDDGQLMTTTPTNLCAGGTPSSVTNNYTSWTWSCAGAGGTANCAAYANGLCGSVHQQPLSETPTQTNACASGILSNLLGAGPWTWNCAGTANYATTASCEAYAPVNGVCGSANGQTQAGAPTGTQACAAGTASAVVGTPGTDAQLTWSCAGQYDGATANCSTVDSCASAVGSLCTDGSKYAGLSTDGDYQMFAMRCDMGQAWSDVEGSCWGTRGTYPWGTYNVATGYTSTKTGRFNTEMLVGNYGGTTDSNGTVGVPPAKVCLDATTHGKTDWYLPASGEAAVVYSGRTAIGGLTTVGYWSSTESSAAQALKWYTAAAANKTSGVLYNVRCVRRQGPNTSFGSPSAFSFTNVTGAALNSVTDSNTVTLTGSFSGATATCGGSCAAIAKNGVWGGASVEDFNAGDTIAIRLTSSSSYATARTATVTVGTTTSSAWSVTTTGTPNAFSFTNQTNAATSATRSSNAVTLAGSFASLTASCEAGCTAIARNGVWGGEVVTGFSPGDSIAIRQTTSASAGVTTTASVTVGATTSALWQVTTAAADAGACGSDDGQLMTATPMNLCAGGTPSSVTNNYTSWSWTCEGASSTATCESYANGACGSASGNHAGETPQQSTACAAGLLSGMTGTGPWSWNCVGHAAHGGSTASCQAYAPVNGVCGTADGQTAAGTPAGTQLCLAGTASGVTGTAGTDAVLSWTCSGLYGGSSASCATVDSCASAVGSVCTDGTVYVGLSTDAGNYQMFTTRCDPGQSWDGVSACTGTRSLYRWGTSGVSTTYTSANTGRANTDNLVSNYGAYNDGTSVGVPAAQYCYDATTHGRTDWYLPAKNEYHILWTNAGSTIAGMTSTWGGTIDLSNPYWTSTESTTTKAWADILNGVDGAYTVNKTENSYLRCFRRSGPSSNSPNAFAFVNQGNAEPSATVTSNAATLSGTFTSATATCGSGCTAIAKNGVWGGTSVTGFNAGDTIAIRQTASASANTATTASVTVGATTSSTWTVTTRGVPDAFSFTNQTGVTVSTAITSNAVSLAGSFANLTATCGAGCTAIARNGSWGGTSVTGFNPGDTITIRQTSSASGGTAATSTVSVGPTTSGTWSVTTAE